VTVLLLKGLALLVLMEERKNRMAFMLFDSCLIFMVSYGVILMIANGWLARTLLWWGSGVCVYVLTLDADAF
jgi:hypothetical protein